MKKVTVENREKRSSFKKEKKKPFENILVNNTQYFNLEVTLSRRDTLIEKEEGMK